MGVFSVNRDLAKSGHDLIIYNCCIAILGSSFR